MRKELSQIVEKREPTMQSRGARDVKRIDHNQ
jgi:hypothetical protein